MATRCRSVDNYHRPLYGSRRPCWHRKRIGWQIDLEWRSSLKGIELGFVCDLQLAENKDNFLGLHGKGPLGYAEGLPEGFNSKPGTTFALATWCRFELSGIRSVLASLKKSRIPRHRCEGRKARLEYSDNTLERYSL
jgi:hypothetical protein